MALQTLDIDIYRHKWALTVQGLKGAAKEDEADTRAAYVELAKDNPEIDDASVCVFTACHTLSDKANAGIIIQFCDLSKRNLRLTNATHTRGEPCQHQPDVPPVLRPPPPRFKSAMTCRLRKSGGSSSGTNDNGPYCTSLLATTDLSDRISGKRQLLKVSWVQTLCLAFSKQMLDSSWLLWNIVLHFPFQIICDEKLLRITASFLNPMILKNMILKPKYTFAVSCNSANTYRHAVVICNFNCTLTYPYWYTD